MQTTVSTDCDFTVQSLEQGEEWFVEDWAPVVHSARTIIDDTLQKLRPVLKYVCQLQHIGDDRMRVVPICTDGANIELWLRDDGVFCTSAARRSLKVEPEAWERFRFARVVDGLAARFAEAENARITHLASICRRREMLDRMLEAMQPKD